MKVNLTNFNLFFFSNLSKGIGYTIGRVPIASTDFSTRIYSYVDTAGDLEMKSFALAVEDIEYKVSEILR